MARAPAVRFSRRQVRSTLSQAFGLDEASIRVVDYPRSARSRMLRIDHPFGRSWIAKDTRVAELRSVSNESWFYANLGFDSAIAPQCLLATPGHQFVVIEDIGEQATLFSTPGSNSVALLSHLAKLAIPLASLHSRVLSHHEIPSALLPMPVLDPVDIRALVDWSPAAQEIAQMVQHRPVLTEALNSARREVEPRGLIHADIKTDNVLVRDDVPLLIDWELCGRGPLAWDLGAVLGSMLTTWLDSLEMNDQTSVAAWIERAEVPFPYLSLCARAFLTTYRAAMGRADASVPSLKTISSFTAAWTCARTWAEALRYTQLTARHHLRLIVAENLVQDPTRMVGDLTWSPS